MTNPSNRVLYIGVTNNIARRVFEHRERRTPGFTQKYNVVKLVYYEIFENIVDAITREKQLKAGSRKKKIELINRANK
jgi:putative endonuclease